MAASLPRPTEPDPSGLADLVDMQGWTGRPHISARSVLVTILGDTVAPLGGKVWLNDVITFAAPFGFNDRLVRTSMFRLVAERWVVNERVGRRSTYSLTPFAHDEFTNADARIYRSDSVTWNGGWTIVFVEPSRDDEFIKHLRWRGFAELAHGAYASPSTTAAELRALAGQLEQTVPAIATAEFDDIEALASMDVFRTTSGLARADQSYREFIDRYEWVNDADWSALGDVDAFVLRTMIVHDLRRLRLRDPLLPNALLPQQWSGRAAMTLAGTAYHRLSDAAWRFVEETTGLTVDRHQQLLAGRFPSDSVHPDRKEKGRA